MSQRYGAREGRVDELEAESAALRATVTNYKQRLHVGASGNSDLHAKDTEIKRLTSELERVRGAHNALQGASRVACAPRAPTDARPPQERRARQPSCAASASCCSSASTRCG